MVCPISHRRFSEMEHPVLVHGVNNKTVYEAEFIVQWFKHHSLMDPVTHRCIKPDLAWRVLRPLRPASRLYLARAGFLDGDGGRVFLFLVLMVWAAVHLALTQIPVALELWLNMTSSQRFWTIAIMLGSVFVLVTGLVVLSFRVFIESVVYQIQNPFDVSNFAYVMSSFAVMVASLSCCFFAFIFVWTLLRRTTLNLLQLLALAFTVCMALAFTVCITKLRLMNRLFHRSLVLSLFMFR